MGVRCLVRYNSIMPQQQMRKVTVMLPKDLVERATKAHGRGSYADDPRGWKPSPLPTPTSEPAAARQSTSSQCDGWDELEGRCTGSPRTPTVGLRSTQG
jgi:hypothetical protein